MVDFTLGPIARPAVPLLNLAGELIFKRGTREMVPDRVAGSAICMQGVGPSVQQPNGRIEGRCEGDPGKVGQEQPCGDAVDRIK